MKFLSKTAYYVTNTYFDKYLLDQPSLCYVSKLQNNEAFPPPPSSSWLRDNNAIYAGEAFLELYGKADRWSVLLYNTTVTFYFVNGDQLVRYDFVSYSNSQGEVGVVTELFNMFQQEIPSGVFGGSGNSTCGDAPRPSQSAYIPSNEAQPHKNLFIPMHGAHKWVELVFGKSVPSN